MTKSVKGDIITHEVINVSEFNKIKYNNEYNKTAYDRFSLMLPKGYKLTLKEHTTKTNESVSSFIKRAIDNQIQADNSESVTD